MRHADRIAEAMRDQGVCVVISGDGIIVDACRSHTRLSNDHPWNVNRAGCDSMQRATDLFKKHLVRAHDVRCRSRLVRAFRLIERRERS